MGYTPITPFRRMVDAAHLHRQRLVEQPLPPEAVNKWEALRELAGARTAFGLSDRDMAVLQALVSFHPGAVLAAETLVVHPSNQSICDRLNGMPCSTMRRHLANLVTAGFLIRRDSPNGKRYARHSGGDRLAYGFDLRPLVLRHAEICATAEALRAERDSLARLRETVSLMRRDLAGLALYGATARPDLPIWDRLADQAALTGRALRRKLDREALADIETRLAKALDEARQVLEPADAADLSINDDRNEQHYQNSDKDSHESEDRNEAAETVADAAQQADASPALPVADHPLPRLPLTLVVSHCPDILPYGDGRIRHWHELVKAADTLRPMMGISPDAWIEAKAAMGPEEAAVVLAAMLQRFDAIRSPGGYLRRLSAKAAQGAFSSGPMVMALMRQAA